MSLSCGECCLLLQRYAEITIFGNLPKDFSNSGRNTTNTHYKIGILQQSIWLNHDPVTLSVLCYEPLLPQGTFGTFDVIF